MSEPVLLVGLGFMGRAYATVLKALNRPVLAIGRSPDRRREFERDTGLVAVAGGIDSWLSRQDRLPPAAIVCVSTETAAETATTLIGAGVKRILLEKPGGTNAREVADLAAVAKHAGAEVVVGYNRRFYGSVLAAEGRIGAEGGVTSFHFEFTERERDATSGKFSSALQHNWVLVNSSHVIDLAFFLGGDPLRLSSERAGSLDWHPSSAQFAGCGRSNRDALFSYCANWTSGGRWSVELMTPQSRLILRPLEHLYVQRRGAFEVEQVPITDDLDERFKPGLYRQTSAFLEQQHADRFINIEEQAHRAAGLYATISGEPLHAQDVTNPGEKGSPHTTSQHGAG